VESKKGKQPQNRVVRGGEGTGGEVGGLMTLLAQHLLFNAIPSRIPGAEEDRNVEYLTRHRKKRESHNLYRM